MNGRHEVAELETELEQVRRIIRFAKPEDILTVEQLTAKTYQTRPEIWIELEAAFQARRLQLSIVERAIKDILNAETHEDACEILLRVWRHYQAGEIYEHDDKLIQYRISKHMRNLFLKRPPVPIISRSGNSGPMTREIAKLGRTDGHDGLD